MSKSKIMLRQLVFLWLTLLTINLYSQDEGLIERKTRFERPRSIGVQIGPLFRLGKADYSGGYSISATYTSRVNRILSIGPAIAFSRFAFQPSLTNSFEKSDVKGNNIFQNDVANDPDDTMYRLFVVTLRGGNLNQLSAGLNFKLDLVPFKSDQKISWSIGVQPFLLSSNRSEVSATTQIFYSDNIDPLDAPEEWDPSGIFEEINSTSPGRADWSSKTEVSGGTLITAGVELALPGNWKLQIFPTLRYTFPITHIKTATFPALESRGLTSSRFPFAKESLTTIGVVTAISYHF